MGKWSEAFNDKYFVAFVVFLALFLGGYPFLYSKVAVPQLTQACQEFFDKVNAGQAILAPDNCTNGRLVCQEGFPSTMPKPDNIVCDSFNNCSKRWNA